MTRALGMALAAFFLSASCGLVDLRPVEVAVDPGTDGLILDSRERALRVAFPSMPLREMAEKILSVSSREGAAKGDLSWEGPTLVFTPVPPWRPAMRYVMRLGGEVPLEDGRHARISLARHFYALRSGPGPYVATHEPADGAVAGSRTDLVIVFSEPMNRNLAESALSLVPGARTRVSWNEGGTVMTVSPLDRWSPMVRYEWKVRSEAEGADGALIASERFGAFSVTQDPARPTLVSARPAVRGAALWAATGDTLEGMDRGSAILIEWSEAVERSSLSGAISFSPGLQGDLEEAGEGLYVFVPSSGFVPATRYVMTIAAGVEDGAGLASTESYRRAFTPDCPFLALTSLSTDTTGEAVSSPADRASLSVTVTNGAEGDLGLTLAFSEPFSEEAKALALKSLSLEAYYPLSTVSPSLKSAQWQLSDSALYLKFTGLQRSDATVTRYYRLSIAGGAGGLRTAPLSDPDGAYLETPLGIFLETKP